MTPDQLRQLAVDLGNLIAEKNEAYGNSVAASAEFLRLLFPEGIQPYQYSDVLLMARIIDKLKRIATRKCAFGESPYRDIAGYGLLGLAKDGQTKTIEEVDRAESKVPLVRYARGAQPKRRKARRSSRYD